MKNILLVFICFCTTALLAQNQQKKEIFVSPYDPLKINHVIVHNSYGSVTVEASQAPLVAAVELAFDTRVSDKMAKLIDYIKITQEIRNDTVILITKFDESLGLKNNLLWDVKDDMNIAYNLLIPIHVSTTIHQKYGRVYATTVKSPLILTLDNAGLTAKRVDDIKINGADFSMDVSGIKKIKVSGSRGNMVLTNIEDAELDLTYSTVSSMGFQKLKAKLVNSQMSSGTSGSCDLEATTSSVEFTNLIEKGNFNLTDVLFVIQKIPPILQVNAIRGASTYSLMPDRNCQVSLTSEDNETELRLRGGTLKLDFIKKKKTGMVFPEKAIVSKKSAEFTQEGSHGAKVMLTSLRGNVVVKK